MIKLYWETTDNKFVYLNGYVTDTLKQEMLDESARIASLSYSNIEDIKNRYIKYVKPLIDTETDYDFMGEVYDECNPWCVFVNYDGSALQGPYAVALGETPIYSGETPTKPMDGYVTYEFIGWDKEIVPITENVMYTAQFKGTITKFDIKFLDGDLSILEEQTCHYLEIPECTLTPQKEKTAAVHYVFKEWNPTVVPATEDAEYYPLFEEKSNTYLVSFYNETILMQSGYTEYGSTPSYTGATPTKTGYVFNTWSPTISAVTGEQSYQATFDITQLKVSFENENTGEVYQTGYVDYGNTTKYTGATPTYEDAAGQYMYSFSNWNPQITIPVTADTIYLPEFINDGQPDYTIFFDLNGCGSMNKKTIVYNFNEKLTDNDEYADPTSDSYSFKGWYRDNGTFNNQWTDTMRFNLNTVGDTSMYLYAKWMAPESIELIVDKTSVDYSSGEIVNFTIESSGDWELKSSFSNGAFLYFDDAETKTSISGEAGEHTITAHTIANTYTSDRSGTFTVNLVENTGKIASQSITQKAKPAEVPYIKLVRPGTSSTYINVKNSATATTISVSANTKWTGSSLVSGMCPSITFIPTTGTTGDTNVSAIFTKNTYASSRTFKVQFEGSVLSNIYNIIQDSGGSLVLPAPMLNFGTPYGTSDEARKYIATFTASTYSSVYLLINIERTNGAIHTVQTFNSLQSIAKTAAGGSNSFTLSLSVDEDTTSTWRIGNCIWTNYMKQELPDSEKPDILIEKNSGGEGIGYSQLSGFVFVGLHKGV